jgi:hypothetical protein
MVSSNRADYVDQLDDSSKRRASVNPRARRGLSDGGHLNMIERPLVLSLGTGAQVVRRATETLVATARAC